jgi:hypothetical protein
MARDAQTANDQKADQESQRQHEEQAAKSLLTGESSPRAQVAAPRAQFSDSLAKGKPTAGAAEEQRRKKLRYRGGRHRGSKPATEVFSYISNNLYNGQGLDEVRI